MNYIKIDEFDTANGEGIGTVLWLAGCNHDCLGCHNPQTHNPQSGGPFNTSAMLAILASLQHPYISRLTLTGGDPLYPPNRIDVFKIAMTVKLHNPTIKIWLYTGYLYEEVKELPVFKYIDVVVDGRFILSKRNLNLEYRGSENQRIIRLTN